MKEICINQDWTFNEVVDNLKELKSLYWEDLALFSYFELKCSYSGPSRDEALSKSRWGSE